MERKINILKQNQKLIHLEAKYNNINTQDSSSSNKVKEFKFDFDDDMIITEDNLNMKLSKNATAAVCLMTEIKQINI